MQIKKVLFLGVLLSFIACESKKDIKTVVYKKGKVTNKFYGTFFSTKYGGLNYYISNEDERNKLFEIQDIDSIVLTINNKNYTCKSIVSKPYSRVINKSDFSFSINEKEHKPIVDEIDNKKTLLFYSAKTDMEEMKDSGIIKFEMID
ncbi:hypothetical protein [Flavobacterium sp. GCM10027622]|uniref:hypothetical protein n=1 Tax=unclassified Flavobacterium TaxID=196869 RepID=UPI0036060618